jgi:hypothetical protein
MRPLPKIKSAPVHIPLRKAAITASPAARRPYPAWIDAADPIAAFPATVVTPRVRDGLILRQVLKAKSRNPKPLSDGAGTR